MNKFITYFIVLLVFVSCGKKTTVNENAFNTDSIVLIGKKGKSHYGFFSKDTMKYTPLNICLNKWLSKELNLHYFDRSASLENRFFEINISRMSQNIDNYLNDPSKLYFVVQEAKAKSYTGEWYNCMAKELVYMDQMLTSSVDPFSNQSYFDTHLIMPDEKDWTFIDCKKQEIATLSLSDGSSMVVEEPLRWHISCQYAIARVMSEIPRFSSNLKRVYFVSEVVLVRNFKCYLNDYTLYSLNDRNLEVRPFMYIEPESIEKVNGTYILARIFSPHITNEF